jgi:hypothetical protein
MVSAGDIGLAAAALISFVAKIANPSTFSTLLKTSYKKSPSYTLFCSHPTSPTLLHQHIWPHQILQGYSSCKRKTSAQSQFKYYNQP